MKDSMIPAETIQKAIYLVRGQKVMLDRDLAGTVRFTHKGAQAGREAQCDTFSRRFHVRLYAGGTGRLEVTICDLQFRPYGASPRVNGFHRTGGRQERSGAGR